MKLSLESLMLVAMLGGFITPLLYVALFGVMSAGASALQTCICQCQ
jgi:hypothetical protein